MRSVLALLNGFGKLGEFVKSCYKQTDHLYIEFKFSENKFSKIVH